MTFHTRKDYGHPLRVWDNGGETADRYTVMPPRSGRAAAQYRQRDGSWHCIGASCDPYHPQGVGMWCSAYPGPHLGKRIHWDELPEPVKRFALRSFPEWAPDCNCAQLVPPAACDTCRPHPLAPKVKP